MSAIACPSHAISLPDALRCWPAALGGRRRLLLHVGLHKTGTTAVQFFLHNAMDRLFGAGVLYPLAGRSARVLSGHHNIAWQLAGDTRFDARYGTVDSLAEEVARFAGDAVVSSEDFAYVLNTPERLAPLLRHPALRGHDITLLLTVREQASYFEALYFELLSHGIVVPAADLCAQVLAEGALRVNAWTFPFDYALLLSRLRQAAGVPVALRTYDVLEGGCSLTDFLAFAGLSRSPAPDEAERRLNVRAGLGAMLTRFCGASLLPLLHDPGLAAMLRGRRAHLSAEARGRMAARFGPGNEAVAGLVGLPAGTLRIPAGRPPGAFVLERLFGAATHAAILAQFGTADPAAAAADVRAAVAASLP